MSQFLTTCRGNVNGDGAVADFQGYEPIRSIFYVCCIDHPNDRIYTENVMDFLAEAGIRGRMLEIDLDGQRPQLAQCLGGDAIGVLSYNSELDRSYIGEVPFVQLAKQANVPVLHWILDHPAARWHEFQNATQSNSRFLFLSRFTQHYFKKYILPVSATATTVGVGPSRHSRVLELTQTSFSRREIKCLIPLNLTRLGRTSADIDAQLDALEPKLANAIRAASNFARHDLDRPIELSLLEALDQAGLQLHGRTFHICTQIVEDMVQVARRLYIFRAAQCFPVLVQSDAASQLWFSDKARLIENVDMKTTLVRMQQSRAVLSVSHVNDMIHDRTLNGMNAGCVNIVEGNAIHRRIFRHGENALLFRYDDNSLHECLELVCNDVDRAYAIAQAGLVMRDDSQFRFGNFNNMLALANQELPS